ncbi:hypothetical protein L1279_000538 [Planomicrobium sp. HSC-17F08]|nr:hypothetical protein [Planomicrobium sp. HSC-17F08]
MKHFKRIVFLLFLSFFLIISLSATPILADNNGDGSPPHSVRGVSCEYVQLVNQYAVKAFPPNHVTAWWGLRDDVVRWTPVLYRWDGTQYIKWRESKVPPAYAYVTPYGLNNGINPGWRNSLTHGQVIFFPFYDLPSGTYTILNVIKWDSNGHVHMEWGPNSCAI